jgi:hypothetical protein
LLFAALFFFVQITASHLALASQAVGLLVTQLPVLRAALASRLPSKHHVLLHSLDRVGKDCQEHQREIFAKLVAIMEELVKHARHTLEQLPWAQQQLQQLQAESSPSPLPPTAMPPGPSVSPAPTSSPAAVSASAALVPLSAEELSRVDDCVRVLMKQTCSLHRALSDLLLPEQRDLVFEDISRLFVRHVSELHAKLTRASSTNAAAHTNVNSSAIAATVKAKLATNIGHIATRLATCTGVDTAAVQQLQAFVQ